MSTTQEKIRAQRVAFSVLGNGTAASPALRHLIGPAELEILLARKEQDAELADLTARNETLEAALKEIVAKDPMYGYAMQGIANQALEAAPGEVKGDSK